jgi:hypothetical protein
MKDITIAPARVGDILKRTFGLRDGIKRITLVVDAMEVSLTVEYLVSDAQCAGLENLQEFRLVPKNSETT